MKHLQSRHEGAFLSVFDVNDAEVGQLWELSEQWTRLLGGTGTSAETYILVRRVGDTNVWDALCVETGTIVSVTLSSLLYDRVV